MSRSGRHDAIALSVLALLGTLFFADVLIGTNNFYLRDLARYYYPAKQVLRDIVLGGEFPYWNRLFSGGQPLAANPEHEVFYPLTWLILLPSYDLGYRLLVIAHVYIGLFSMYALLRSMRLRASAAAFGAASFGLGGVYLSYINLLPILFSVAWLPLTCLYTRRFLLHRGLHSFSAASLFFGIQFLVGEPTTVAQTGLLLGMYALYRGWHDARRDPLRWKRMATATLSRVAMVGAISCAGFLVGAVQMLPAIDHAGDSVRSRKFAFSTVTNWHLPAGRLPELVFPNYMGHITSEGSPLYWGRRLYAPRSGPFLYSIYPGLLAAVLAISGFVLRSRGSGFTLLLCGLSLAIALGPQTPIPRLLYDAGAIGSIRYLEKFFLIAAVPLVVLAATMFDRLMGGDPRVRKTVLCVLTAVTGFSVLLTVLSFLPGYTEAFASFWRLRSAGAGSAAAAARTGWILAAVRGLMLLLLVWGIPRMRRPVWLVLASGFLALDLAPINAEINPRITGDFYRATPAAVEREFPRSREEFRVFHAADWASREDADARRYLRGLNAYWTFRNGLFPVFPAAYGLATVLDLDYDLTALLPTADLMRAMWKVKASGREDWWQPFAAMSNVWYRGVYRPFEEEARRVGGRMERAQPVRFEQVEQHPRYYFAEQIVSIRDTSDVARMLAKGSWHPRVAFVPLPAFDAAHGEIVSWRETANRAWIDVRTQGRSFLVMSVTPHKYWRVAIDGAPVRPVVTNIGYQGIEVPAGSHRIEMHYRNDLVVVGAWVSGSAVIALAAGLWLSRRRALRVARERSPL